jgi:hypothetical protein
LRDRRKFAQSRFGKRYTGFNTYFSEVGGGNTFAINGLGQGRDWATLGAGLACDLGCD